MISNTNVHKCTFNGSYYLYDSICGAGRVLKKEFEKARLSIDFPMCGLAENGYESERSEGVIGGS